MPKNLIEFHWYQNFENQINYINARHSKAQTLRSQWFHVKKAQFFFPSPLQIAIYMLFDFVFVNDLIVLEKYMGLPIQWKLNLSILFWESCSLPKLIGKICQNSTNVDSTTKKIEPYNHVYHQPKFSAQDLGLLSLALVSQIKERPH